MMRESLFNLDQPCVQMPYSYRTSVLGTAQGAKDGNHKAELINKDHCVIRLFEVSPAILRAWKRSLIIIITINDSRPLSLSNYMPTHTSSET